MSNLVFSLGVTMPVFLMVVLGYVFRLTGMMDEIFAKNLNDFVFKVLLPVMLFKQLATTDFISKWDGGLVLYCFCASLASILLMVLVAKLLVKPRQRGEFIQGSFRASQALLGLAYLNNLYGKSDYLSLMLISSVILYNTAAVIILMVYAPAAGVAAVPADGKKIAGHIAKGIVTNPLIIGMVAGIVWCVLGLPLEGVLEKVVTDVAKLATPLGLIAMGASLDLKKMSGELGCALLTAFFKLIGLAAVFLPLAALLGYSGEKLATLLIMLGAPTTVSAYVMAKKAGYEGVLTSDTVILTTVLSSFTMTFWIWALKSFGLI